MIPFEEYRGIEFIRISSLSTEHRAVFWQSFDQAKIIKILKDDCLLNDCVLVKDFLLWRDRLPAGKTAAMAEAVEPNTPSVNAA